MSEVLSDKEGGTSVPPEDKDYLRLLGQNEKLRDENGKLWRRLKEHAKTDEHDLSIISALHEAIKARREVAPARLKKLGKGVMKATGILDIGDTHYGEGVSPVSTGGVAEFSREIAKKRFDYTIDEAIRLGKENNVQELWMILGGDMTNG